MALARVSGSSFPSGEPRLAFEMPLTAALLAVAVAGTVAHALYLSVPLVDDAAISLAYASTLVAGHGLRLTPASQVVEGFSNPLWTFLLALAGPLHVNGARFATNLGAFFTIAAVPVYGLWGFAARGWSRLEDALGPLLMAATTTYVYWGCSGMETGLQSFLLGLAGVLVLRDGRRGCGSASGVVLGLLCVTRPDGALYVAAAGLVWLAARLRDRRRPGRQEIGITLWVIALAGGYIGFRRIYFADWLPNTYYAKGNVDFALREYVKGFCVAYPGLLAAGVAGAIASSFGGKPARNQGLLALAFSTAAVLFVVRAHGDWMREWRFFAPATPCLAQCACAGLSAARDKIAGLRASNPAWRAPSPGWLVLVVLTVATFAQARTASSRSAAMRKSPELPMSQVAALSKALEPHIRALGLVHPRLAFPDVGGLAMTLRSSEIIDTGLLADIALARWEDGWARGMGNPTAAADYLANDELPDYIDIHAPDAYLKQDAFRELRKKYVPLHTVAPGLNVPAHILVLAGLSANDDPRCPGGRRAVRSLSPSDLAAKVDAELDAEDPVSALALWRCAWAWTHERALPDRAWRDRAASNAESRSLVAEHDGRIEAATRYEALASVLSAGDAAKRHRTEDLRGKLHPPGE
jgi:hypothetical protein